MESIQIHPSFNQGDGVLPDFTLNRQTGIHINRRFIGQTPFFSFYLRDILM
jgi:hypothetical protein